MRELIKKVLREEVGESYYLPEEHPIVKIITKLINTNDDYETETIDFYEDNSKEIKIKYSVNKVRVWSIDDDKFEGTIYLNIDGLLMYDGDGWTRLYGFHDIPEYVWDDFYEFILEYVSKFIPIKDRDGFLIDIEIPTQFE
jgi:hypothetical protein